MQSYGLCGWRAQIGTGPRKMLSSLERPRVTEAPLQGGTCPAPTGRRRLMEWLLRGAAQVSRHYQPRGMDRLLRALHPPDKRGHWSIQDRLRMRDGALVDIDTASWLEWRAFFFREYEPELTMMLRRYLRTGDVAIDVGANIGLHSLTMAGIVGPAGRIIACEPSPSVAAKLRRNLELNRERGVTPLEVAVSDREGLVELAVPAPSDANQGRANLAAGRGEGWSRVIVRGVTIDRLVEEFSLD